jgi:gluconolactonase
MTFFPASFMTSRCVLFAVSALAVTLAACTSSAPVHTGVAGAPGTAGAAGNAMGAAGNVQGTGGNTMGAGGNMMGAAGDTMGAAGGTAGASGTTGLAGAGGGSAGAAGTTAGTGGSTGSAGATAGTGGSTGSAGATAGSGGSMGLHRQYTCPPGPYPAQKMGTSTAVCVGYDLSANGVNYVEGPTWVPSQNAFFFSNFAHSNPGGMAPGNIVKVDMNGTCSTWLTDVGTNGLHVGADGNIIAACHKTRSVTEFDINTKQARIIADMYMGKQFDSPNDLVVRSDGNIYFSNPNYELGGRPAGFGPAAFRIDPMGVVTLLSQGGEPNGAELSPDEKTLYIVQAGVWTLDASGNPTKTNQGPPNADGFAVDCAGNFTIQGTNSAFGGPDGKTLIVVSNGGGPSVKFFQMTVPGMP